MKKQIIDYIMVIVLACFGGLVGTLTGKPKGQSWSILVALPEVVIAIFSGLMIHFIFSQSIPDLVGSGWHAVVVAMGGYSARGILYILNAYVFQRLKAIIKAAFGD